jgi:hypothetical protein
VSERNVVVSESIGYGVEVNVHGIGVYYYDVGVNFNGVGVTAWQGIRNAVTPPQFRRQRQRIQKERR